MNSNCNGAWGWGPGNVGGPVTITLLIFIHFLLLLSRCMLMIPKNIYSLFTTGTFQSFLDWLIQVDWSLGKVYRKNVPQKTYVVKTVFRVAWLDETSQVPSLFLWVFIDGTPLFLGTQCYYWWQHGFYFSYVLVFYLLSKVFFHLKVFSTCRFKSSFISGKYSWIIAWRRISSIVLISSLGTLTIGVYWFSNAFY